MVWFFILFWRRGKFFSLNLQVNFEEASPPLVGSIYLKHANRFIRRVYWLSTLIDIDGSITEGRRIDRDAVNTVRRERRTD